MTVLELPLGDIRLDAGLQVRAAVDQELVEEYALRMIDGAVFPPVTVWLTDAGDEPRLVDGYHRYYAARRVGQPSIAAEAHLGTRAEALWFALGANRANGQRLNDADKTRAVQLALQTWPERTQREIAIQVGCSDSLVSKVAVALTKTTGGDHVLRGQALVYQAQREAVRVALLAGEGSMSIRRRLHAHSTTISSVKRELGMPVAVTRPVTTEGRLERIQEMATSGHSSAQIAAVLGITEQHCRALLRRSGHTAPADDVTRGLHRHDSNRIMARIVADAGDLTAGANLIDFAALDHDQLADWIETLRAARTTISRFIARLAAVQAQTPQQQQELSDGEATDAQAV